MNKITNTKTIINPEESTIKIDMTPVREDPKLGHI